METSPENAALPDIVVIVVERIAQRNFTHPGMNEKPCMYMCVMCLTVSYVLDWCDN